MIGDVERGENMHKVKVESAGFPYSRVYLDGQQIRARKLDVHIEVDCMPETDIAFKCDPDLDYETLVTVDFTPHTINSAVNVLKAALKKNDFIAFMGMNDLLAVMEEKNDGP